LVACLDDGVDVLVGPGFFLGESSEHGRGVTCTEEC
jgi:hypothetical protein